MRCRVRVSVRRTRLPRSASHSGHIRPILCNPYSRPVRALMHDATLMVKTTCTTFRLALGILRWLMRDAETTGRSTSIDGDGRTVLSCPAGHYPVACCSHASGTLLTLDYITAPLRSSPVQLEMFHRSALLLRKHHACARLDGKADSHFFSDQTTSG